MREFQQLSNSARLYDGAFPRVSSLTLCYNAPFLEATGACRYRSVIPRFEYAQPPAPRRGAEIHWIRNSAHCLTSWLGLLIRQLEQTSNFDPQCLHPGPFPPRGGARRNCAARGRGAPLGGRADSGSICVWGVKGITLDLLCRLLGGKPAVITRITPFFCRKTLPW